MTLLQLLSSCPFKRCSTRYSQCA